MELSPADFKERWPNVIFLHYARQLEVLEKASLTICHGVLNAVIESIAKGVPLIALPVGDDQPGVGARVEWSGIGRMILARKASAGNLREAIKEVLSNARYQQTVRKMQIKLNEISGADRAADIIENLLWN